MNEKPVQGFAGLWNISFGFFGIQIGFALQNANMSRIFQTLGGSLDDLSYLWVAAPLTGVALHRPREATVWLGETTTMTLTVGNTSRRPMWLRLRDRWVPSAGAVVTSE